MLGDGTSAGENALYTLFTYQFPSSNTEYIIQISELHFLSKLLPNFFSCVHYQQKEREKKIGSTPHYILILVIILFIHIKLKYINYQQM
jgi:hypothetical protein